MPAVSIRSFYVKFIIVEPLAKVSKIPSPLNLFPSREGKHTFATTLIDYQNLNFLQYLNFCRLLL